jgi:hypothetical protein
MRRNFNDNPDFYSGDGGHENLDSRDLFGSSASQVHVISRNMMLGNNFFKTVFLSFLAGAMGVAFSAIILWWGIQIGKSMAAQPQVIQTVEKCQR